MSDFEEELVEEIESFDDIRDEVRDLTNEMDFAVAAWHEDGRWTLATLPDPYDIAQIITRLKSQQTNGGSIALIAIKMHKADNTNVAAIRRSVVA